MVLYQNYSDEKYPHYINFDAIEVKHYKDIPLDYDGMMGVPVSFIQKFNPDQFELIGSSLELADMSIIKQRLGKSDGGPAFYIELANGSIKRLFNRIVIKRKL